MTQDKGWLVELPDDIATMSDEELDALADELYATLVRKLDAEGE